MLSEYAVLVSLRVFGAKYRLTVHGGDSSGDDDVANFWRTSIQTYVPANTSTR